MVDDAMPACSGWDAMIHHLALTASDLARSIAFYDSLLPLFGYVRTSASADLAVWAGAEPEVLIYEARPGQRGQAHRTYDPGIHHVALEVSDRITVRAAVGAAIAAGGVLLTPARAFPEYGQHYYAAFLEDPDGIKLEVMTRNAE